MGVVLVVACKSLAMVLSAVSLPQRTQVEVVGVSVTDGEDGNDGVDDGWRKSRKSAIVFRHGTSIEDGEHTGSRRVLPEVLRLVSAHKALRLDLWSCASGKLLVEAHHALHASSICGSAKSLNSISPVVPHSMWSVVSVAGRRVS